MSEEQIQAKLKEFEEEIFFDCNSREKALDIKKRLEQFEEENNVTFEQLQLFAESGAGETLYMMTTYKMMLIPPSFDEKFFRTR